jgi:hypothetical protein
MSFDRNEITRLRLHGGAVLAKYQRLVGEADRSAHDSPAQRALGNFQQAWIADPNLAAEVARDEAVAAIEAHEAAARSA